VFIFILDNSLRR